MHLKTGDTLDVRAPPVPGCLLEGADSFAQPQRLQKQKRGLFCARSQYDVLTVGMLQKQREKWNTEEGIIPTGVTHAGEGMSQLIYSQRGAQAAGTVVDCQLWFCRAASGRMKGGEIAPAAAEATSVRGEGGTYLQERAALSAGTAGLARHLP